MIKQKPVYVPVIGEAHIELYDAYSGKKQIEALTENCISSYSNKIAYYDYFMSRIKGVVTGGTTYYAPFQHIVLTNNSLPEDPNGHMIRGVISGWADKSAAYSGSLSKRGTINTAETTLNLPNLHFVFDFPTNAGNGTFQSLYWGHMYNSNGYNSICHSSVASRSLVCKIQDAGIPNSYYYCANAIGNNKVFVIYCTTSQPAFSAGWYNSGVGSQCTKIYKLAVFDAVTGNWLTNIDMTAYNSSTFNYWCSGDKYILFFDGANKRIVRININTYEITTTSTGTNSQGVLSATPVSYINHGEYVYILDDTQSSSSHNYLKCYDMGMNLQSTIDLWSVVQPKNFISNTGCAYVGICDQGFIVPDNTDNYGSNATTFSIVDWSGNLLSNCIIPYSTFTYAQHLIGTSNIYENPFEGCAGVSKTTVNGYDVLTWQVYAIEPYGAQTLLASPLTKLSTQTMKIWYDFTISMINPYL